jgi:hypothetical protein
LEKVEEQDFNEEQRQAFFKSAKKQVSEAEKLDPENAEHRNLFFKIDYEINSEYDRLPEIKQKKNQKEEQQRILNQASIMCDQYPALLGTSTVAKLKKLIYEIQEETDVIASVTATEKLDELINEHSFILAIFLLKVTAHKAAKSSPNDANLLLKKHDSIVNNFKEADYENGYEQLNEAWKIASKYLDEAESGPLGRFLKK